MIQIENICKSFGSLRVLQGVSFGVQKGEMVSVVGKSGAGKTTLLQIMGALDVPDSGKVYIGGEDIFALKESMLAQYRNKHIGFIFQFHQLLPEFTAIENVMMPALIGRLNVRDAHKRAEQLLRELSMGDRMQHKPSELSGGEKQRVAAARAMMMQPDVILADEPSGSLDEANKHDLHNLLRDMQVRFGHTIVIVTHDKELAAISDRVIELRDGMIASEQGVISGNE